MFSFSLSLLRGRGCQDSYTFIFREEEEEEDVMLERA